MIQDESKHSELQNRIGKAKNGKTLSSKKAGTKVKESSSLASELQAKQPFALRTRSMSFNDRQVTGSKTKPTPAPDKAHLSKVKIILLHSIFKCAVEVIYSCCSFKIIS